MELTHRPFAADISFYDICYQVSPSKKVKKTLLDGVSGIFNHGLLNGIMGPSGAGKSSLLNALAGFKTGATGTVVINGREHPLSHCSEIMSVIGNYILQDDCLFHQLSVRESLNFAAWMKLPSSVNTKQERERMTKILLDRLSLSEVANRRVGLLSGGQRKRVSVAVELINFPPVLYIDEPTTGLDSVSSYRLIGLLKEIAVAGCNVICTIHQPNSKIFHMFDTLMVLAKGGRCAYQGPVEYLVDYMQICQLPQCGDDENPADFLFEENYIERMVEAAKSLPPETRRTGLPSKTGEETDQTVKRKQFLKKNASRNYIGSFKADASFPSPQIGPKAVRNRLVRLCSDRAQPLIQFFVLLQRSFLVYFRDTASFWGRLIAAIFCTVLLGVTYQGCAQDATKVYVNTSFMLFLNMMSIIPPVITSVMNGPDTFGVVLRENINAWYNISVFYWAKSLADIPFQLFISWIIPVGTWFLTHQLPNAAEGLSLQVFVLALVTILSQGVGFILGCVADERSAQYLPFAVILMTWMFGGYMINFSLVTVVLRWIHYLVFGFASYWALLKIAYRGDPALPCSFELHPLCQKFRTGYDVLTEYEVARTDSLTDEVIYLLAYTILIFLVGWGLLILLIKRAKRHPVSHG